MGYVTIHTIWMDRVILSMSAIFNFILFALLLKQIHIKSKQVRKTSASTELAFHIRIMNIFALSTLFCNGIFNIIRVPVSFGAFQFVNCGFQSGVLCSLWTTGKYFLYLFFVSRLDVAFYYSAYSLSRRAFFILYTFVSCGWLLQQIVIIITWKGVFVILFNEPWQFCATATPVWVFSYLVIYDAIITIVLLSIFIYKLHSASSQRHSISGHEVEIFWNKISKYVTLTIVGVSSTIICMLMVGITSWITFTATDTNINSICVFFMYGAQSSLFHKLCCCCYNYCGVKFVNKITSSRIYTGSLDVASRKKTELKSKTSSSRTDIISENDVLSPIKDCNSPNSNDIANSV